MKVFVAGATGALGKELVPALVARGHDVVGMTRTREKADLVRQLGAEPAIADGLDADAVGSAVGRAEPDVVVHQMTALSGSLDLRDMEASFAQTNRLRTAGTDHLLAAARAAGATRFIAQSYAGWPSARTGGPIKTEDEPLDPDPPAALRAVLDAIRYLERSVTQAEGIDGLALRYGGFYGPGTSISLDPVGEHVEIVRKRKFPIVGDGAGIWSLIHIADAATATVAAVERGEPGVYNVVDDEPARVSDWLPGLASAVGAKPPRRVPRWLGRILAGEAATKMMTEIRGASNEKAKREFGWQPAYPTWREGFARGLG
jgi:nucleoside-diphosphate-sugar epimerase